MRRQPADGSCQACDRAVPPTPGGADSAEPTQPIAVEVASASTAAAGSVHEVSTVLPPAPASARVTPETDSEMTVPLREESESRPTPTTPYSLPSGPPPNYPPPGYPPPKAGMPRQHPASYVLAALGLALALVAAIVVVVQFQRPRGGAESPEAAVELLVEAIVAQDPIGVIDLITPAEVEGVDAVYGGAVGKAAGAGLVGKDELLDAVTIDVTGLELETEELSDGLARVEVTDGSYRLTWDTDRLPPRLEFLGATGDEEFTGELVPLLSGFIGDVTNDLVTATIEETIGFSWPVETDLDPSFLTMATDGRWFVSLLGTYVDWLWLNIEDAGGPLVERFVGEPDWDAADEPPTPVVGEDLDEVAANTEDAVNSGDGVEILATLPGELVRPLAPYRKVIGLAADLVEIDISDLEYETSKDGELQEATLSEGTLSVNRDLLVAHPDGRCIDYAVAGVDRDFCWSESSGIDETFVMLRKSDGGYQLDPIATAVAHMEIWVANATDETIQRQLDSLRRQV